MKLGDEIFLLACKRDHTTEKIHFTGLSEMNGNGDVLFEEPRKVEINGRQLHRLDRGI